MFRFPDVSQTTSEVKTTVSAGLVTSELASHASGSVGSTGTSRLGVPGATGTDGGDGDGGGEGDRAAQKQLNPPLSSHSVVEAAALKTKNPGLFVDCTQPDGTPSTTLTVCVWNPALWASVAHSVSVTEPSGQTPV